MDASNEPIHPVADNESKHHTQVHIMAAPQNEQEYIDLLRQREQVLTRIKSVQTELDAMGFMPADQQQYNRMLQERVRLLDQQKRTEQGIAQANPTVSRPFEIRQQVQMQLQADRQRQQALTEQLRLQRDFRAEELRQRYGSRMGGAINAFEQFRQSQSARMLGGGLTAFGAFAGGMANRGFAGTVESARLDDETTRLAREFGAIFKPFLTILESGTRTLRQFMEGLSGTQQRLLALAAVAGGAMGLRAMGGRAIGAVAGGLAFGPAGAVAGGLLAGGGAAATAGGGAATTAGVSGGGAALAGGGAAATAGFRARAAGALGIASKAGMFGGVAYDTLRGVGLAEQLYDGIREEDPNKKIGMAMSFIEDLRKKGGVTSGLGFDKLFLESGYVRRKMQEAEAQGVKPVAPKKNRDQLTPNIFGYEDLESAYKRASISALSRLSNDAMNEEGQSSGMKNELNMAASGAVGGAMQPQSDTNAILAAIQAGIQQLVQAATKEEIR